MSKIIKLTAENVKRLSAVEITPNGNVVVIGGRNGQGKSSVLDAIQYALGGDPDAKMPVRRGEEKAKVVVDLGDIVVRRTFTAGGGTALTVTNADGVKQLSPQAILDKLVGTLTFDPLAFSREKPKQQAEILRHLVGLDFTRQDAERDKLFNERTAVNREAKALEARMAAMPKHVGIPDEEISTASILAEQQSAARKNAENLEQRRMAAELEAAAKRIGASIEARTDAIEETRKAIVELEQKLKKLQSEESALEQQLEKAGIEANAAIQRASKLNDIDLSPFQSKASEAEAVNRKVRENRQREEVVKQYKAKADTAEALTKQIDKLDAAKRKATTDAKYPVEGLMFDASGGVTLNGIPFDQCSAAEQLRVSVAVGLALNPKLRVLLIRDGSLLDDDSMKSVLEMAQKADAQVWVERVATDAHTSVVIEDGHIAETAPQEELL